MDMEKTYKEKDGEKDTDYFQPASECPACLQEYDVVLILPCSHTMCCQCIAAGETKSSVRLLHLSQPVCSVMCPCCRHPVELPSSTWSSATSCLPKHPTLSPARITKKPGREEGRSGKDFQHREGPTHCRDSAEEPTHSCSHGHPTCCPVDGAVDLEEKEMMQSVFGLDFALNPSTASTSLSVSKSSLTVTYQGPPLTTPCNKVRRSKVTSDPKVPLGLPQVCGDVIVARGQYYWEVDVCNSSVYRIGVISVDGSVGWWLERQGSSFCAVYDGSREPLHTVPPHIKNLGVFLNIGGGVLSFHNTVTQEHLATLPTRFGAAGVLPAFGLGQGCLRIRCCLPPPSHVFCSKDSTYRGPRISDDSQWPWEIAFKPVRSVIQRFEQMAVTDSALVSSFGPCSSSGGVL